MKIAVFDQQSQYAPNYARLGFTHYFRVNTGVPSGTDITNLKNAGLKIICPYSAGLLNEPTVDGWIIAPSQGGNTYNDEPDNAQNGLFCDASVVTAAYATIRAADASRQIWVNLGQGVINKLWPGHGLSAGNNSVFPDPTWYDTVCASGLSCACDVYPYSNLNFSGTVQPPGYANLGMVHGSMANLLTYGATNIAHQVEAGPINYSLGIAGLPLNVIRSEAWQGVLANPAGYAAGTSLLIYFAHNFVGGTDDHYLLHDPIAAAQVARVNAELQQVMADAQISAVSSTDGNLLTMTTSKFMVSADISGVARRGMMPWDVTVSRA